MADVSMHHLRALAERGRSWAVRHENLRKKGEEAMRRGVSLLEVGAGGLGSGVIAGRFPTTTVVGLPPDLLIGGLLAGAGIFGAFGKESEHSVNFGNGFLAGFLARFGSGIGAKLKNHQPLFSGQITGGSTAGALPSSARHVAQDARENFARTVVEVQSQG